MTFCPCKVQPSFACGSDRWKSWAWSCHGFRSCSRPQLKELSLIFDTDRPVANRSNFWVRFMVPLSGIKWFVWFWMRKNAPNKTHGRVVSSSRCRRTQRTMEQSGSVRGSQTPSGFREGVESTWKGTFGRISGLWYFYWALWVILLKYCRMIADITQQENKKTLPIFRPHGWKWSDFCITLPSSFSLSGDPYKHTGAYISTRPGRWYAPLFTTTGDVHSASAVGQESEASPAAAHASVAQVRTVRRRVWRQRRWWELTFSVSSVSIPKARHVVCFELSLSGSTELQDFADQWSKKKEKVQDWRKEKQVVWLSTSPDFKWELSRNIVHRFFCIFNLKFPVHLRVFGFMSNFVRPTVTLFTHPGVFLRKSWCYSNLSRTFVCFSVGLNVFFCLCFFFFGVSQLIFICRSVTRSTGR